MTYYGINSSSQYGSNFSSVLADSPPPLDDTVDEDDEFVFRGKGAKETRGSCTVEHKDASYHYQGDATGTVEHKDASYHYQGDATADEFGDFEAFADFKESETIDSASTEWFSPLNAKQQVQTDDDQATESGDDFADFEGFRNCASEGSVAYVGERVTVSSTTCSTQHYECPNETQHGGVPVSNAGVDDFGDFSVADINDTSKFPLCFDSTKNVCLPDESLNGEQLMKQGSSLDQQEFKASISETTKGTASCFKESIDSDDFGEFGISQKIIDENLDSGFQGDMSKSMTKDPSNVKMLNSIVAPMAEDSLAMAREPEQSELQCFNNHELNTEMKMSGGLLKNEKTLSGDAGQDDFECFKCSDDTRHLSKSGYFSTFEDIRENSSHVSLCEQTNQVNNPLDSKQAKSDELSDSLKANTESELDISSETCDIPADFSLLESASNVEDPDNFGAFDSAICVRDTEQVGLGIHEQEHREPETKSGLSCTNCTVPSGLVSISESFVQHKADGIDVEQPAVPNNAEVNEDDDFGDFSSIDSTFVQHKADDIDVEKIADAPRNAEVNEDDDFSCIDSTFVQHKADDVDVEKIADAPKNAEVNEDEDFGDFSSIHSTFAQHQADDIGVEQTNDAPKKAEVNEVDDFGDFSSIDATFVQHKADGSYVEKIADAPKNAEVNEHDDFGDFSSIDSTFVQHKADRSDFGEARTADAPIGSASNMVNKFGNFNSFDSLQERTRSGKSSESIVNVTSRQPGRDSDEDFGDFGTFISQPEVFIQQKYVSSDSEETVKSVATKTLESNGDEDFGDFDTFNSQPELLIQQKAVSSASWETAKSVVTKSLESDGDEDFGDFDTFNSQPEGKATSGYVFPAKDTNASQVEGFADFGAFRSEQDQKNNDTSEPYGTLKDSSSNVDFTSSQMSANLAVMQKQTFQWKESSQGEIPNNSIKEHPTTPEEVKDIYVVTTCNNMVMSELVKAVMLCFSATKPWSRQQGNVNSLDVKLHQGAASQFKVWEQLKSTVVDGRLRFQWEISLGHHKTLTALNATVQSLPTASYVRADVQSLPPFATGLSLLEPMKGPFVPATHHSIQDISSAQDQTPLEEGLPDLNFGLRRFPSHKSVSDIKDSSSDTMSESSSLDLDFLGPSLPNLHGERREIKSHYEDDLLGLNLGSGNLCLTSADKVKGSASDKQQPVEKKANNTRAVWQFGDVTIPLASQNTELNLSDDGRALVSGLEDLAFMQSPVLMFPIKST